MKKSLLALAILGTFAGAASAQTNVTIYGLIDVGISRTDTNASGVAGNALWSMDSGIQSGSRLGFRGSEDLGGGLSAIFTLENGFNVDNGTLGQGGRLFGRQAWFGLNGNFGTVKLGRQYSPLFLASDTIDPFNVGLAGSVLSFFGGGLYGNLIRMDNTISYTTPTFDGFSGSLYYGLGETARSTSANAQTGVGLAYVNGPLNVQFAYHDANASTATVPVTSDVDTKTAFLGATYDFRIARIHAAFADTKVATGVPAGVPDIKQRNWMLGVSAPVGAGAVLASWSRNDLRGVANGQSDLIAIGYIHNISKRTNLYTSLGRLRNDSGAAVGVAAAGVDATIFNVGIRHKF